MGVTYKQSGVDTESGDATVRGIRSFVSQTFQKEVIQGIGLFGSAVDLSLARGYQHPVLVQSIDGVGTKGMVAAAARAWRGIGRDIVAHCCNDVVAMGARPFTFLDYIAADRLDPEIGKEIVEGMAEECRFAGVSLVGGETAEMPGVYRENQWDIVGAIAGIVERGKIITGTEITKGDIVLGVASSGLHTNGFSLARHVFFQRGGYAAQTTWEEVAERAGVLPADKEAGRTLGEVLLVPHKNYTPAVLGLLNEGIFIKGIAHITGGGLSGNISRIVPDHCTVEIWEGSWDILPIFSAIQAVGPVDREEMYRVYNMGIGIVLIVSEREQVRCEQYLSRMKERVYCIGRVKGRSRNAVEFIPSRG